MVEITALPLELDSVLQRLSSPSAGAVVVFLGVTREWSDDRQTEWLQYECYREMAERQLHELEAAARQRWPLVECLLRHRVGRVDLGEASVLVAVSTPHRQEAFAAAQWLMDQIKREVAIWKQEHRPDGHSQWVHPGVDPDPSG